MSSERQGSIFLTQNANSMRLLKAQGVQSSKNLQFQPTQKGFSTILSIVQQNQDLESQPRKMMDKKQSTNNLSRIKTQKHLDKVVLEIDSPLFKKACHNLGVDPEDCVSKTYESFQQPGLSQEIIELRWKHFRSRLMQTINEVLEERQRIKRGQKGEDSMDSGQQNSMFKTIQTYNQSTLRVASNKVPIAITRSHFSVEDLSVITDQRVTQEYQKLEKAKQKFLSTTRQIISEDSRKASIQTNIEKKLEKVVKSSQEYQDMQKQRKDSQKLKYEKVRHNQELLTKDQQITQQMEEKRMRQELDKKQNKLDEINRQQLDKYEKQRKEYEQKQKEVLNKLQEKHSKEMQDCIQKQIEIEDKMIEKTFKHELVINEYQNELSMRNQKWKEKNLKIKQEKQQKELEDRISQERNMHQTNLKLEKKGREALKFLKELKMKKQSKKQNQDQLKQQEDEQWRQKCESLDRKFEQNKKLIDQHQKEVGHEFLLKREMRRLREEEIKKMQERKKQQRLNRKIEILERDVMIGDNLQNFKSSEAVLNHMKMKLKSQFDREKSTFLEQVAKITHGQDNKLKNKQGQSMDMSSL